MELKYTHFYSQSYCILFYIIFARMGLYSVHCPGTFLIDVMNKPYIICIILNGKYHACHLTFQLIRLTC